MPSYFVLNPLHVEFNNIPKYKKAIEFDELYQWYHTMVVYPFHLQQHIQWLSIRDKLSIRDASRRNTGL